MNVFPLASNTPSFPAYNPTSEEEALNCLEDFNNRVQAMHTIRTQLVDQRVQKTRSLMIIPIQNVETAYDTLIGKISKDWQKWYDGGDAPYVKLTTLIFQNLRSMKFIDVIFNERQEMAKTCSQALSCLPSELQILVREYSDVIYFLQNLSDNHRILDLSGLNLNDSMFLSMPKGLRMINLSRCTGLAESELIRKHHFPELEEVILPKGAVLKGKDAILKAEKDFETRRRTENFIRLERVS